MEWDAVVVQHADINHTGITGAGGSLPSGTSFPGSPASNDLFYRTDRDILYFYDGTRWLTVNLYVIPMQLSIVAQTADTTTARFPVPYDAELYLVEWDVMTFLSGTAIWLINLNRHDSADSGTLVAQASTSGDSTATWTRHNVAINAVLDSSARVLTAASDETTGTATINWHAALRFRLIG